MKCAIAWRKRSIAELISTVHGDDKQSLMRGGCRGANGEERRPEGWKNAHLACSLMSRFSLFLSLFSSPTRNFDFDFDVWQ